MLFVVAALTSGALGGVSEAFGVHENNTFTTNITQPVNPSGQAASDTEITGTVPVVLALPVTPYAIPSAHELSTLTGTTLLTQLSTLPQSSLMQFAKADPQTLKKLMASPPAAASVSAWWSGLGTAGQTRFSTSLPQVVGNLDGVPFTVRDSVNREYLTTAIGAAKHSLSSGIGRAKLVSEKHHLEILEQIARTLAPSKSAPSKSAPSKSAPSKSAEPARQLLTFEPAGNAKAAVSVGNVETADYVTYLVPGMFFTVQGQVYDWTTIAQQLHSQQDSWLKTLAETDPSYRGKTAATVAWIGYSTPGVLDIASLKEADQGADLLGSAIHGVQAVRANSMPYITVVAHSYGSTAAMIELSKGDVTVNALAMIGSPGAAAQTASSLSVSNDNVFVGEAAWDPVVNTAFYGSDPGSAAFGAKTMDVAAATDPITGKKLAAAVGHLGYFDSGSTAMRNLALIGLGQGSLVLNGTTQDASRTLGTTLATTHGSAPTN